MNAPLAFAEAGFPIIPVQLEPKPNGGWRKQPMTAWSLATTEPAQIADWWRAWPDALPGIPLARVGWAAIDVDDPDDVAFREVWGSWVCKGPHSAIRTPSGGMHYVFAQPSPPITKLTWSAGVEILGSSCLLTVYDVEELLFPRVAPRAILPEVFTKPSNEEGLKRNRINNRRPLQARAARDAVEVADLTAALRKLDPRDFSDYHEWFALMTGASYVGISERDWVDWSTGDPDYAADGPIIRKMWRKLDPYHGGAFWAALKGAGIRIAKRGPLINEVPLNSGHTPTRNLRRRLWSIQRHVEQAQGRERERALFCGACTCAEIIAEPKSKLTPSNAKALLVSAAHVNGLLREIGKDEVHRTISNGLRWVEEKLLAQGECK
jgi:Bifunctional DNA primase/polymerase, N-terminal/Primase C terminal 2 (PriCT-2)